MGSVVLERVGPSERGGWIRIPPLGGVLKAGGGVEGADLLWGCVEGRWYHKVIELSIGLIRSVDLTLHQLKSPDSYLVKLYLFWMYLCLLLCSVEVMQGHVQTSWVLLHICWTVSWDAVCVAYTEICLGFSAGCLSAIMWQGMKWRPCTHKSMLSK